MKSISGRFDCPASSSVSTTGTSATARPPTAPAASGLQAVDQRLAARSSCDSHHATHPRRQQIDAQQRDLIASAHDEARNDAGRQAPQPTIAAPAPAAGRSARTADRRGSAPARSAAAATPSPRRTRSRARRRARRPDASPSRGTATSRRARAEQAQQHRDVGRMACPAPD